MKIDISKINPRSVSKLTDKTVRELYSELRSILRKRNERAEAKGLSPYYPTPAPIRGVPPRLLRSEVQDIAAALRDPMSSLMMRGSREGKIAAKLASHDYHIPINKLDDFGRFMEATRKRQGETYKGKSKGNVQAYEELVKTGVSGKTIDRSFKYWLESEHKLNTLVTAAQNAKDTHPDQRVTSAELRSIMEAIDPMWHSTGTKKGKKK